MAVDGSDVTYIKLRVLHHIEGIQVAKYWNHKLYMGIFNTRNTFYQSAPCAKDKYVGFM